MHSFSFFPRLFLMLAMCASLSNVVIAKEKDKDKGGEAVAELEERVTNLEERLANSDLDNDGYTPSGSDCNDADSTINPESFELGDLIYDGVDNDCDGTIDNPRVDNDLDGFPPFSDGGTDCDDLDETVFPGQTEFFTDNKDHNCDRTVELRWNHGALHYYHESQRECRLSAAGWLYRALPGCGDTEYFTPSNFHIWVSDTPDCDQSLIDIGYAAEKVQECR